MKVFGLNWNQVTFMLKLLCKFNLLIILCLLNFVTFLSSYSSILASLLSVVIISTIVDFKFLKVKKNMNDSVLQIIESVSIKQNFTKLHKVEENEKKNDFISKNR